MLKIKTGKQELGKREADRMTGVCNHSDLCCATHHILCLNPKLCMLAGIQEFGEAACFAGFYESLLFVCISVHNTCICCLSFKTAIILLVCFQVRMASKNYQLQSWWQVIGFSFRRSHHWHCWSWVRSVNFRSIFRFTARIYA